MSFVAHLSGGATVLRGYRRMPAFMSSMPAAPGPGDSEVVLPETWQAVALPASGYICPSMAALAMARGAVVAFEAATGKATIGGAVLVSVKGKIFCFSGAAAFDTWAAINKARLQREAELVSGLSPSAAATMKAKKAAELAARAAGILDNAASVSDAARQAAMVQESSFLTAKWYF